MFGCLFLPRMCSLFMTQRGVVFMQMPHNHHSFPCSHPYPPHPHLLTLLALSTTLWSPASCAWSITTGSRTQTMMGHRPRWQQSPGSFFKRQRTTSEQHWGRHLEVRKAQAPPPRGSNGAVKEDTQIRWRDSLNTHQERGGEKAMRGGECE